MGAQIESLVKRLREEGSKSLLFFQALTPDLWEKQLYSEGTQWTIKNVMAHFVSAEAGIVQLIENILSGGSGVPEDFDLDGYNERRVMRLNNQAPSDLLSMFDVQRETTVAIIDHMTEEQLIKKGRHPWLGIVSVNDIIKLIYRHNQIHQRDIRRMLTSQEEGVSGVK